MRKRRFLKYRLKLITSPPRRPQVSEAKHCERPGHQRHHVSRSSRAPSAFRIYDISSVPLIHASYNAHKLVTHTLSLARARVFSQLSHNKQFTIERHFWLTFTFAASRQTNNISTNTHTLARCRVQRTILLCFDSDVTASMTPHARLSY